MPTLSSSRKMSLERLIVLPWIWLKRARGWRRRGLLAAYTFVGLIALAFGWRAVCLSRLPDVGDPFDVAAFEATTIPDDENGFTLYRQALNQMVEEGQPQDPARLWGLVRGSWKNIDPPVRAWTEANRRALELWRQGTERPKALAWSLKTVTVFDEPRLMLRLDAFTKLALLEGARLEDSGDMAGAWRQYHAVLRFGRHLRSYGRLSMQPYVAQMDSLVYDRLIPWARDSRTDPALLRQALDGLLAQDASSPPPSQSYKVDYLALMHSFDDPVKLMSESERANSMGYPFEEIKGWHQIIWFFTCEPERSRRIVRLTFANRLAQCDKPESQRPKLAGNHPNYPIYSLYVADPAAPYAARALPPKDIFAWLESSAFASRFTPSFNLYELKPESEAKSRAGAIVHVAEALYERENGTPPASALLGRYLKRLPPGYEEPDHDGKSESSPDR